jgi:uncharacterized protein (DUF427 family)
MDKIANPAPGFKSNPDRRITIELFSGTVTVTLSDAIIASSSRAKVLREGTYGPVLYIPFANIHFERLKPSETSTHCQYKGEASYWSGVVGGEIRKDVMWAYQHPYDEMLAIKDHGAFYPDRVRIETTEG